MFHSSYCTPPIPSGGVDAGDLDSFKLVVAGDLAHEQEGLFAERLRELVDGGREVARGAQAHVFCGVDSEAVEVGAGDSVFVR